MDASRHESRPIPYGRQSIDEDDISAVVDALRSDWLTTGPRVAEFEQAFAARTGSRFAVAVNSGTAALHSAMYALDIDENDEVIVPTLTFAASANCVVYQGGTPVFADIDRDTLLLDLDDVQRKITRRTRAIVAVDYAGHPADYEQLRQLAGDKDIAVVADACHALGGARDGEPVGALADLSAFSLHPVKHITSGEGGVITTDNEFLALRMQRFRNHGISRDLHQRQADGDWHYEIASLGYNYRLSDIQCALAKSQLAKLDLWIERRRRLANKYDKALASVGWLEPILTHANVQHAYHLYVVKCKDGRDARRFAFGRLRELGIGVNVHYIPVHRHPYYQRTTQAVCPVAEEVYEQILSLPMFPTLSDEDFERVIAAIHTVGAEWEGRQQAA